VLLLLLLLVVVVHCCMRESETFVFWLINSFFRNVKLYDK